MRNPVDTSSHSSSEPSLRSSRTLGGSKRNQPPTPKLALFAITTFVASSATFAIATALAPVGPMMIGPTDAWDPPVEELVLRQTLDERMHMHLKRLQLPRT